MIVMIITSLCVAYNNISRELISKRFDVNLSMSLRLSV